LTQTTATLVVRVDGRERDRTPIDFSKLQ